jgi:hypothetical protein
MKDPNTTAINRSVAIIGVLALIVLAVQQWAFFCRVLPRSSAHSWVNPADQAWVETLAWNAHRESYEWMVLTFAGLGLAWRRSEAKSTEEKMRTTVRSLFLTWLGGVSLAVLYVVWAVYLAEGFVPFSRLWAMGITPIAILLGSVAGVLLSPLTDRAFLARPARDVLLRGGMLWGALALYLVLLGYGMTRLDHTDTYGLFTLIVPLSLASCGIWTIGRTPR